MARLKRIAGGGVIEAASRALGEPYPSVLLARRGDVVAVRVRIRNDEIDSLGIVDDSGAQVVTTNVDGLIDAPLESATHAWGVG